MILSNKAVSEKYHRTSFATGASTWWPTKVPKRSEQS